MKRTRKARGVLDAGRGILGTGQAIALIMAVLAVVLLYPVAARAAGVW